MASSPSSIDAAINKLAKDANGEIMLHFASRQGCPVSCRFLVEEAGLDVNSVSKTGHCEAVRLLPSKGAHVDVDPIDYQGAPLHLAAGKDHNQVVVVLLEHGPDAGADVNARDYSGSTPLTDAVDDGLTNCVKVLLDAGANSNIPNQHGTVPIELAAASGRHKLVQILFPGTKLISSLPDWSVDGIIKTVNSPKISPCQIAYTPSSLTESKVRDEISNADLDVSRATGQTMKAITEVLRVCTMYPLLVFLLAILLLSTRVYSVTHDTSSNEGSCRYDMISVAVLSCMQADNSWRSPSVSCCKALIHAIDELPASGENGKCCLCRFMRAKLRSPELAATYISCHGKDRDIVAKWSFPVTVCGKACSEKVIAPPRKETVMERPLSHSHSSKILFILFGVLFIILLIFILYLWWVSGAAPGRRESLPLRQARRSSPGSGRRQSSGRFKERRASG